MRLSLLLLALVLIVNPSNADSNDLAGGVLIAHHPIGLQYTSNLDLCEKYISDVSLDDYTKQHNRIDIKGDEGEISCWFVIAAWTEPKEWCGLEFGLGEYSSDAYQITEYGFCCGDPQAQNECLQIPTDNWPGPNESIAFVSAGLTNAWSGRSAPVYYFAGYAYGETVIPLTSGQTGGGKIVGNCLQPSKTWAMEMGAMGVFTDGLDVYPVDAVTAFDLIHTKRQDYTPRMPSQDFLPLPASLAIAPGNKLFVRSLTGQTATLADGDSVTISFANGSFMINEFPVYQALKPAATGKFEYCVTSADVIKLIYGDIPDIKKEVKRNSREELVCLLEAYQEKDKRIVGNACSVAINGICRGMSLVDAGNLAADYVSGFSEMYYDVRASKSGRALMFSRIGHDYTIERIELLRISNMRDRSLGQREPAQMLIDVAQYYIDRLSNLGKERERVPLIMEVTPEGCHEKRGQRRSPECGFKSMYR